MTDFQTTCTLTFKKYDYYVEVNKKKWMPWSFVAQKNDKTYAIFCKETAWAHGINNKALIETEIQLAQNSSFRPVLIVESHSADDRKLAEELDFCLVEVGVIKKYYDDMVLALKRGEVVPTELPEFNPRDEELIQEEVVNIDSLLEQFDIEMGKI